MPKVLRYVVAKRKRARLRPQKRSRIMVALRRRARCSIPKKVNRSTSATRNGEGAAGTIAGAMLGAVSHKNGWEGRW